MKITFLYNGDSSDINEWSNFPYFITESFKDYGCDINRVNMSIRYIGVFYDFFVTSFIKRFLNADTSYNFLRSKLRDYLIDRKLKYIVKKYSDTELFFCISDNFNPFKYTSAKCVMLCDWTYEFEIERNIGRRIDRLEQFYCKKQNLMMEKAYSNIIMRDECREYVKNKYDKISIYDKHIDVVNCLLKDIDKISILNKKKKSNKIIFLGAKRYIEGAKELVNCIQNNKEQFVDKEVHFIGIEKEDMELEVLEDIDTLCFFWGYLNKADEDNKICYYNLLQEAKMCINTNIGFVSIAGLMEACYLYNPVIVSKHYQTLSVFGEHNRCGFYVDNEGQDLLYKIKQIFEMEELDYCLLCNKSHESFADKSWYAIVDDWVKSEFGKAERH